MKRRLLVMTFSVLVLTGCVVAGPPNNTDFHWVTSITEFAGVYRNVSESSNAQNTKYLSSLIWPENKSVSDSSIESIEVRPMGSNTLVIKAHGKGGVLMESTFVEGKDFVVSGGRVTLTSRSQMSGRGAGSVGMAAGYFSSAIGLDEDRHGKFRASANVAGLFLVFPFAFIGTSDFRFSRIGD